MDPMNPGNPIAPAEPAALPAENETQYTEAKIVGYCRTCGKPLTEASRRVALGTVFCEEHAPSVNAPPTVDPPSPYAPSPAGSATVEANASGGLAFFLGLIPGVGAIYNGQYAKGFVHVVIFGLLISLLSSENSNGLEPLFGMMLAAFVFYQAFEAFHTAKRRAMGQPVDEFSSLVAGGMKGYAAGPMILIGIGVLFLLNNFGLLHIRQVLRFWPVLLIGIGVSMLMARVRANRAANGVTPGEAFHEQR